MKSLKKSFSKKTIAAVLALTVMTGAALQPKRAEAGVVSAITGVVFADAVFSGLLSISATSLLLGATVLGDSKAGYVVMDTIFPWSVMLTLVLDDSGEQKIALKPIDNESAKAAGVTSEEQDTYNQELDIIQASFDDISAQVAPLKASERAPQAGKLWNDYRSTISPAAFSALQKVTAHLAQKNS